jgi:hypothetical protein
MTSPFSLLGRGLPASTARTVYVIAEGDWLRCDGDDWREALAVVEHGNVEIQTAHGGSLHLEKGASFCLAGLDSAVIRTRDARAVVATVRRIPSHRRWPVTLSPVDFTDDFPKRRRSMSIGTPQEGGSP